MIDQAPERGKAQRFLTRAGEHDTLRKAGAWTAICLPQACRRGLSQEPGKETARKLNANGLSHLGLRVTHLAWAKHFSVDTLGYQVVRETDAAVFINVSGMLVALYETASSSSSHDRFNPFRVGLDHLALAVENSSILEDLKRD